MLSLICATNLMPCATPQASRRTTGILADARLAAGPCALRQARCQLRRARHHARLVHGCDVSVPLSAAANSRAATTIARAGLVVSSYILTETRVR